MAIYDLGTASLAANGEVTGVGTTWKSPLTLIRVGATIVFKTEPVQIYTISEIISDTQINVYNPNSETVPAGTGYAILAHDGITVQGLAQDVAETLRYYQSKETSIESLIEIIKNSDIDVIDGKIKEIQQLLESTIEAEASAKSSSDSALEYSNNSLNSSNESKSARDEAVAAKDEVIEVINNAGDAGTLVTLASSSGASLIGTTDGVTVQDAVNQLTNEVSGIDKTLRTDLADTSNAGKGDALIGVKSSRANTISRTQHEVNNDWLSVKDWGAKGDGVTDDTAAIDAACAALTGASLVTNFRRLYLPHGTYIYNGAGITLPSGTTICGEDLFTIIDASNNANSGYLVTLVGFGARLDTLRLHGNYNNPGLKGISSNYNTDGGGVTDAILQDFHIGIDIDKSWYTVFQNIRFRRSSGSVKLTGAHIRIGYNLPNEEVNNINFSRIWMAEQQRHSVLVNCPTQVLTWNECSFESKGRARIMFNTTASVNTFVLNSCYIEGDVESTSHPYLVEAKSTAQGITCNDCMFRLGTTASSLGRNVSITLNGGWSNSPTVSLNANGTQVWMQNYRYLGSFADAPDYAHSGDFDGTNNHSAPIMMQPRPMTVQDWNAVIPEMVNYKAHPSVDPVEIYKVFIPAATPAPKLMHLEIDILTKSVSETYIIGSERYTVDITLPEASGSALSGALITKVYSQSSSGATLLSEAAISLVSNGYDSATDSFVYTIRHTVSNPTRLGNSMFILKGSYVAGGISTTTQRWRIARA